MRMPSSVRVLRETQNSLSATAEHPSRFCFNCVKDPHSPLPCKLLPEWMEKCEGEGESIKYITANTKNCPKCHSAVEKNGGCNLMSCRCGTFFCWVRYGLRCSISGPSSVSVRISCAEPRLGRLIHGSVLPDILVASTKRRRKMPTQRVYRWSATCITTSGT